ncbi:MAG: hypothetical protein II453_10915 [Alphaproteobacteria bacterium]|nr:hypothetical protein [Alphaproteobacteria bacterium]
MKKYLSELYGRMGQLLAQHGDAEVCLERGETPCIYTEYTNGRLSGFRISVEGKCDPIKQEDLIKIEEK